MASGGSLSHHHGIGKLRKKFAVNAIGENGITLLKKIKKEIAVGSPLCFENAVQLL